RDERYAARNREALNPDLSKQEEHCCNDPYSKHEHDQVAHARTVPGSTVQAETVNRGCFKRRPEGHHDYDLANEIHPRLVQPEPERDRDAKRPEREVDK